MACVLAAGCAVSPPSATTQPSVDSSLRQQLETAQLAFTAAEGVVAALEAANVIKPSAATQINSIESATAAALAKATMDVAQNDSQAQTSVDALNSAIAAYSQAIAQAKANTTN